MCKLKFNDIICIAKVNSSIRVVGGNMGHGVYLDKVYKAKIPIFKDNPLRFVRSRLLIFIDFQTCSILVVISLFQNHCNTIKGLKIILKKLFYIMPNNS